MPRDELIELRGGSAVAWTLANPILADREPGVETDTGQMKVGDGGTDWNNLSYIGSPSYVGNIEYFLEAGYSGGGGNTPLTGNGLHFTSTDGLTQSGSGDGNVTGFTPGIYAISGYSNHDSAAGGTYELKPLCSGSANGNLYGNSIVSTKVTTAGGAIVLVYSGTLSIDAGMAIAWRVGSGAGDASDARIIFTRIGPGPGPA